MSRIHTESITETYLLILVGENVLAGCLGRKRSRNENNNKIPWWKRRIQTSIAELRRHVAQLQQWNRTKLSKNRVKADLERKYYLKNKDHNVVIKEMKKIKAKTTKLPKYDERNN